ncbi:MAG: ATP-binding cassette domain-containing protein, partial [Pseudomonadota bacterium]
EIRQINKNDRLKQAAKILDIVELGAWGNKFAHELSGGMQQRVGLARAMAVDPEILIFDEPFSALDPLIRREMQDELLRLQATLKKTMVFITHDFLEAIKMGDHIAIMKDGRVSQIGTPEEIVANPVDSYVRDFTEDVPRYKVLSAGKVMRTASNRAAELLTQGVSVPAAAKLDDLIESAADRDEPLPVVDARGALVGEIDRSIIMRAMSSRA